MAAGLFGAGDGNDAGRIRATRQPVLADPLAREYKEASRMCLTVCFDFNITLDSIGDGLNWPAPRLGHGPATGQAAGAKRTLIL